MMISWAREIPMRLDPPKLSPKLQTETSDDEIPMRLDPPELSPKLRQGFAWKNISAPWSAEVSPKLLGPFA